ncbi:HlyD family efflux transporter periplasmic adaptor subunit [Aquisediminimonas sediminicola]|uniref:HlyD family secretion protein n=1 Tax=Alteraquisediminimonas sediminicola TaxID=2676787 RepID=UPI001C8E3A1C
MKAPRVTSAPETTDNSDPQEVERDLRLAQRKRLFGLLAIGIVCLGLLYGLYDWLIGSRTVTTDNAYVGGNVAVVSPLITSTLVAVEVTDTQFVKKGQILARLSSSDAAIALNRAEAEYALARRIFSQQSAGGAALTAAVTARDADMTSAAAQLATAEAALKKATLDYDRRDALAKSGAVSGDELTFATNALAAAKGELALAKARVRQSEANRISAEEEMAASLALTQGSIADTNPAVIIAKSKLEEARLNMNRTVLRAPIDGIISQRQAQIGQRIAAGTPIMTIVPTDSLYVDANFKESQLAHVGVGKSVTLVSMLYGDDVVYHGKVMGLAGGTGNAFALIPAQNATGNWVKITQRLPVRIAIDPKELRDHPLRIGLSMEAEVQVR